MDLKQERTLIERFRDQVLKNPETEVYIFLADGEDEEEKRTLAQLGDKTQAIGKELLKNAKKGDRALLLYPPGLDFVDAFWACLNAGIVAVPVPLTPNPNQVRKLLENTHLDSQSTILLTNSAIFPLIAFQQQQFPETQIPSVIIKTDELVLAENEEFDAPEVSPEDIAFLQYTSGSTSQPKGVIVKHKNLLENIKVIAKATGVFNMDGGACWLPHFHDMGLVGNFMFPVLVPGPLVFMSPLSFIEKPIRWLQMISKYKMNISAAPNFAYQLCIKTVTTEEKKSLDLSSWDVALSGSEPIQYDVLEAFADYFEDCGFKRNAITPCYGMAEATLMISSKQTLEDYQYIFADKSALQQNKIVLNPSKENTLPIVSCGNIDESFDLKIIDPDTNLPCVQNEIGEIWLNGPSMSSGYWNRNSDSFNNTFEGKNYFKTGDLGFINKNQLYITGRIKDMIIIRGKNYYPQDIEIPLNNAHNAIRKGCIVAFSKKVHQTEQFVIATEIKRSYKEENYDEIAEVIRANVNAKSGINPVEIHLLKADSIPKTTSGKLQRAKTKMKIEKGTIQPLFKWERTIEANATFNGALMNWIKTEIAATAGIQSALVKEDTILFDLGIESIQLPLLLDKLRLHTGKRITIEQVVDKPTLSGIIEALENTVQEKEIELNKTAQSTGIQNPKTNTDAVLPDFDLLMEMDQE